MKDKPKRVTIILYSLAMLLSGIISIFIVCSISIASMSTRKLLEYKELANISYQSVQKEITKVKQIENSIFAKWPKWLMASIAALIGIFSFPAFFIVIFSLSSRFYEKVCSQNQTR